MLTNTLTPYQQACQSLVLSRCGAAAQPLNACQHPPGSSLLSIPDLFKFHLLCLHAEVFLPKGNTNYS